MTFFSTENWPLLEVKPLYYPIHLQSGNLCTLGSTKLKRHLYGQFLQFRTFASFFSVASILECTVEKRIECNTIQDSHLILQHCRPFDMVYKCNHTCLQFSQEMYTIVLHILIEIQNEKLTISKIVKTAKQTMVPQRRSLIVHDW